MRYNWKLKEKLIIQAENNRLEPRITPENSNGK